VDRPGAGVIRRVDIDPPGPDDATGRTLYSAVSRGTESLVFHGATPASQYARMRAPFQDGKFPGPVKYGYLNVGLAENGSEALRGRPVFCLFPHQTTRRCPRGARVLAGTVETAVNALWDAAPLVGERIAVVGGDTVGYRVAAVAARIPGARCSKRTSSSPRFAPSACPRANPPRTGDPRSWASGCTTSATRLRRRRLDDGHDYREVSEWLGHADYATTLRVYAHCIPDTRENK